MKLYYQQKKILRTYTAKKIMFTIMIKYELPKNKHTG